LTKGKGLKELRKYTTAVYQPRATRNALTIENVFIFTKERFNWEKSHYNK